jgi:uncharacterized membrane protein YozB (DUF420 family)
MDSILSSAPDARLASDLSLLAYIFLIVPAMLVGFVFARNKKFRPHHRNVMTAITIVNWIIILFLMLVSYRTWVLPAEVGGPFSNDRAHIIPTLHMITGGVAQILATYLVILMWTERTRYKWVVPKFLQIQNIKPFMRTTLALWLVTAALGLGIFLTWYAPSAGSAAAPVATEEVVETPEVTAVTPTATEEIEVSATEEVEEEVEPAETEEVEPVETEEAD